MLQKKFQEQILLNIPRVLSLLDKNPYSKSYGCLDRKYWQYKIVDFPSGMHQELVAPLAYVYSTDFAGNGYYACPRIKEYLSGIFRFHTKSINTDGSLDDYFPNERALGATAYALAALVRAYGDLSLQPNTEERQALEKSAHFLVHHKEAGTLANHHAIAVYALTALAALLDTPRYLETAREKVAYLQTLQHADGWFLEYEGCDLGYQTVTLEFLARAYIAGGVVPWEMLEKLLVFLRGFVHPDGSLGGEYGSRNTFNFYPGGCALLSHLSSNAAALLGYFEYSLEQGTVNYLEDDGVFGHGLSSMVTALCANSVIITPPSVPEFCTPWIRHYVDAGLYRAGVGTLRMYGNLNKGGCYKVFRGNKLLVSDTGYMGRLKNGDVFCQNTPNNAREVVATNDRRVASSGLTHKYNNTYLSIVFSIALRLYVLFFGKIPVFSRILRRIMQTMLIYKKKTLPVRWSREVILDDTGITVRDAVRCENRSIFVELFRTTDAVNLHVVTSNSFQQSNLFMWERCADTPTDKYEVRHRYEVQP